MKQRLNGESGPCFTNPLILCIGWRIGSAKKVQFSGAQQPLKVVINGKKNLDGPK